MTRRTPGTLLVPLSLALAVAAGAALAQDAAEPDTEPSTVAEGQPPAREPFAASAAELAAGNDSVVLRSIGTSVGGRSLDLLTVGDPEAPWAALVVAGLHGRRDREETRLALDVAAWLVEHEADLPAGCAFHVLADASPDANAAAATVPRAGNDRPLDEDHDGDVDEDPADDLDGDGRITWMRVPDPAGAWLFDDETGRPVRAEPAKGKPGTHRIEREGIDDDGDELWNEDGPGGVDLARNFTWRFEEHAMGAGAWPASEPGTRAILDLLLADERIAVVYEIGGAETVATTPGWSEAWRKLADDDAALLDGLRALHAEGAIAERKEHAPGAGSLGATVWHQLGRIWVGRAPLGHSGPVWPDGDSVWRDDLDALWTPVSGRGLPAGTEVLAITSAETSAPDETSTTAEDGETSEDAEPDEPGETPSIFEETGSMGEFLRDAAAARAVLAFTETHADGTAGVLRLRTRVVNTGRLPTHTARGAELRARRPLNIRIDLPEGAALAAGRPHVQIERLAPGAASDEMTWVVTGASGAVVRVRVTGPDTGGVTLEETIR